MHPDVVSKALKRSQNKGRYFEMGVGVVTILMGIGFSAMSPMIVREQVEEEVQRASEQRRADLLADALTPPVSQDMKKAHGTANVIWWVGIIAMLVGAILVAQKTWFAKPDIAHMLQNRPQKVVWLYKKVSTGEMTGVQIARFEFLVFGLDTGKRVEVKLGSDVLRQALEHARTLTPYATVGYTAERERSFKKDPTSLRQDAG